MTQVNDLMLEAFECSKIENSSMTKVTGGGNIIHTFKLVTPSGNYFEQFSTNDQGVVEVQYYHLSGAHLNPVECGHGNGDI